MRYLGQAGSVCVVPSAAPFGSPSRASSPNAVACRPIGAVDPLVGGDKRAEGVGDLQAVEDALSGSTRASLGIASEVIEPGLSAGRIHPAH